MDICLSSKFIPNTGIPLGCVLIPLLYSLFIHNCISVHGSNSIIKSADGTLRHLYREEVEHLAMWGADNNLSFNSQKTKEPIVGYQWTKKSLSLTLICINGAEVEHCLWRVKGIIKDISHPNHRLLTLLPSTKCNRSFC